MTVCQIHAGLVRLNGIVRSLWWIFSILLGLCLSRVVVTIGMTIRLRTRHVVERIYAPTMLWYIFLFLFAIEVWLSAADIQIAGASLTLLSIASLTVIPIGIIGLVELIVFDPSIKEPDSTDTDELVSQETQFQRSRLTFFVLLALVPVFNLGTTLYLDKTVITLDVVLQFLVIAGALIGMAVRSTLGQTVLASTLIALMLIFIVIEYEVIGLLPALLAQ